MQVIVMRTRLSCRERQAMALLALEQTNKEIAFALGISASTVGVLLHRAAQKLQTTTRGELIAQAKALDIAAREPGIRSEVSVNPNRVTYVLSQGES
jgi:DNA-binding CsgD family transcriptional regulator